MDIMFFKNKILTPGQLKRLAEHKYSSESLSILDRILQPWWNWLVGQVPIWVAPNLITIVGLFINIITTLVLVWYCPDAKTEAPRWAYILCALGLFAYQSLDAIDGKQARRTGSSSPLGELFDHGCDSVSTVFVAVSACISVQLGAYPSWMFFQCFCALTLFYCAHWQAYVSGTVKFGRVDVTEAQVTIIGIHLISAVFGPEVWSWKIPFLGGIVELYHSIPGMTLVCGSVAVYRLLIVICNGGVGKNGSTVAIPYIGVPWSQGVATIFLIAFFQIFLEFCHIFWTGGIGKNGSTVALPWLEAELKQCEVIVGSAVAVYLFHRTISTILKGGIGKNGSSIAGTSVLSPIIPLSLVVVPAFIICHKSTEHVYENHPVLYIMAFGLVAAKVTNRLVVAHMTRNEMDYLDTSLFGPTMLFLNQYFNFFIREYVVLWICLVWVLLDLIRYSYQVCHEICDHMRIKLFSITPVTNPVAANKNVEATFLRSEDGTPLLDPDDDEYIIYDASLS
ncbi:cholinephosphotransferase 1 isoform X2 [Halyomorpha halys]|uniref:cholinephosphotransferase 1 isoform X2 n=1 Tax=Halyomorpha halys TaxID=286706 RepID=UPI0034D34D33